jgi:hypothetical protein
MPRCLLTPGRSTYFKTCPGVNRNRVSDPGTICILDREGDLQALSGESLEFPLQGLRALGQHAERIARTGPTTTPPLTLPRLQIERSDLEKRLEKIGRDVQALHLQMQTLTKGLQQLQKQLSTSAPER